MRSSEALPSIIAEHPKPVGRCLISRVGWAVLICATLYACYFSHLGAIGFVGPDEPRYAWVARAMVETGDWVTPRLYGRPWFEKPVLYYWEAATCFKLFGVNEAAARLPSAISALLATLAMAWLAWRVYGAEAARWFLLLLPTSVGMIGFSHAAAMDMPFSGMLTIALVCAAVALGLVPSRRSVGMDSAGGASPAPTTSRSHVWIALVLFGFFMGLAVLAKGPAAIVLIGGAIFFWALFTKRWGDSLRLLHPMAIVAFCTTALPWYVLCARRNPDFFRVFIIEHNFKRYLTPEFQHIQPFWYYGIVLLVAFLPWSVIFVWAAVTGAIRLWRTRSVSQITLLLICWSAFCLLFFSISTSKLPGYILPAIPPIALLLGSVTSSRWASPVAHGISQLLTAVLLLAITIGVGTLPSITGACVLGMTGLTVIALNYSTMRSQVPIVCAAGWALTFYFLLLGFGRQALNEHLSAKPILEIAQANYPMYSPEGAASYQLQRSAQFALDFYLHRELADWHPTNRTHGWVFTTRSGAKKLESFGVECSKGYVSAAQPLVVCADEATTERSGQRREGEVGRS